MRRRPQLPPSSPSALLLRLVVRSPPSCATLIRARCLSRRARSARRGVKRGVVSGVKGNPRVKGINLSSRGPMRVLSRGYQGIALGYDLGYNDTIS